MTRRAFGAGAALVAAGLESSTKAARAFEADAVVPGCTYGGDALTLMEARRREDKAYLMALHFNVHVDASDARTCLGYLARYVNDAEAELAAALATKRCPPGASSRSWRCTAW